MSTKAYDQQKCLKIFMKFLLQFVLVKWGDRESWNIYDFNHGKPHLNTSTCPIQNMNNIFHHTLCGTQTFVQKTCFVSDPCRSCLWWHIDLSWSFQVGSNEQFSSFERKSFNEHIYNIILASFSDDFNFLKACSSPKTMSCGVQGGPWTRWTWNFLTSRSRKEGKGLGFVIPRNFRETHLNTPSGVPKLWTFRSNQTLKKMKFRYKRTSLCKHPRSWQVLWVSNKEHLDQVFLVNLADASSLLAFEASSRF